MIDIDDIVLKPFALFLRFLFWLGWDMLIQTIGWSVGWIFFRVVTVGHFPTVTIRGLANVNPYLAAFIELTGLGVLAFSSYVLYVYLGLAWHL
ncbi:MAG: hypothetical protein HOP20_08115 [Sulfuriferula sp.]|nr:hypothetical protein [Sulfuriferula sp.]